MGMLHTEVTLAYLQDMAERRRARRHVTQRRQQAQALAQVRLARFAGQVHRRRQRIRCGGARQPPQQARRQVWRQRPDQPLRIHLRVPEQNNFAGTIMCFKYGRSGRSDVLWKLH